MRSARLLSGMLTVLVLTAAATLVVKAPVRGADAQDSPATLTRPGADITDTYLFPSPSTPGNVVAVMNVHAGIAAGQGGSTFFDQNVLYQMKFDNKVSSEASGTAPTEDLVIQFSVGAASGGTQQVFVYGPAAPNKVGTNTSLLAQTGTGFANQSFQTTNGMTVFMGARSDPFFFATGEFYNMFPNRNQGSTATSCLPASFGGNDTCPNGFGSTMGDNSQAGSNVLSIVVEMPEGLLEPVGTGPKIAYWATTSTANGQ